MFPDVRSAQREGACVLLWGGDGRENRSSGVCVLAEGEAEVG